jgi:mannosyltransferase OCH1-like enzyme
MKIPSILLQTDYKLPENHVIEKINTYFPNWNYYFFNDLQAIKYFIENPLPEFPDIIKKFVYISSGAHRADLFRYYFLYLNGGIFMDSDAMIMMNIYDFIHPETDFFSVNSNTISNAIFQGFIGTFPKNPIIYEALKQAYETSYDELNKDYHILCKQLYKILEKEFQKSEFQKIQIFYEKVNDKNCGFYDIHDSEKIVLKHYASTKVIPL